jgi:hypothetical protein
LLKGGFNVPLLPRACFFDGKADAMEFQGKKTRMRRRIRIGASFFFLISDTPMRILNLGKNLDDWRDKREMAMI